MLTCVWWALAGCGGGDPARLAREHLGPELERTATTGDAAAVAGSGVAEPAEQGVPVDAATARAALLAAARGDTAVARQFRLDVSSLIERAPGSTSPIGAVAEVTRVAVTLEGERAVSGAANATGMLRAGPLQARIVARLVADRLYLRRAGRWYDLGAAGGITLDVGRELLVHPHLVRVRGGERFRNGRLVVRGTVRAGDLTRQARTEPTGLVAAFLSYTHGIRFVAVVRDSQLVADRLTATVRLPQRLARVTGMASVGLEFRETYEPLAIEPTVTAPAHPQRARSLAELLLQG